MTYQQPVHLAPVCSWLCRLLELLHPMPISSPHLHTPSYRYPHSLATVSAPKVAHTCVGDDMHGTLSDLCLCLHPTQAFLLQLGAKPGAAPGPFTAKPPFWERPGYLLWTASELGGGMACMLTCVHLHDNHIGRGLLLSSSWHTHVPPSIG